MIKEIILLSVMAYVSLLFGSFLLYAFALEHDLHIFEKITKAIIDVLCFVGTIAIIAFGVILTVGVFYLAK